MTIPNPLQRAKQILRALGAGAEHDFDLVEAIAAAFEADAKRVEELEKAYDECGVIIRNLHPQYGAGMRALESRLTAAESKLKIAREALERISEEVSTVNIARGFFTQVVERPTKAADTARAALTALDSEAAAAAGVEK